MKKIIFAITVFLTINFGLNAYTLRENVQETLSKRGVKQSIINETSDFLLDSRGKMSIVPQQDEILNLRLWEGDKIFLKLLFENSPFFYLTLDYENDDLIGSKLEFKQEYSSFEVFVPEKYVEKIVENLQRYSLLTEGFYADVYSTSDTIGHWKTLEGGSPFDGEVGKSSVADEKIMKFRVKRDFEELAYYLVKEAHPYETAIINVFRMEV